MSDKSFMTEKYIRENDVINRYCQRKLSAEEIEMFEVYLLDKPSLIEQLEANQILMNTIPHVTGFDLKTSKEKRHWIPWSFAVCATAASVLLSILYFTAPSSGVIGNLDIYYLSSARSATADDESMLRLRLDKEIDTFVLVLPSTEPEGTNFSISLAKLNDQALILSEEKRINDLGEIYLPVNADLLSEGQYELRYSAKNKKNTQIRTVFTVELTQ